MKTGPLIGLLGINVWFANFIFQDRPQWLGWSLGVSAVLLLMAATIITGARKGRTRVGLALSLLSVLFGLGFLIILLVPAKESPNAA